MANVQGQEEERADTAAQLTHQHAEIAALQEVCACISTHACTYKHTHTHTSYLSTDLCDLVCLPVRSGGGGRGSESREEKASFAIDIGLFCYRYRPH